ncbi:MAG: nucleotide exchange factor GrpE [Cocleimonas sp.]|nr:nucleotide exchange factor GrpE [Cocleimonas sp.]
MSSEKTSTAQAATGAVNTDKDKFETSADIDPKTIENEAADAVAPNDDQLNQLRALLAEAEDKVQQGQDNIIRLQAERENQRKRTEKQVSDAHKFASQKFIEQLLPVIDSLEMGLQAEGDLNSIREGMTLTLKQFESVMEKSNLVSISPLGEKFNPDLHQAMAMQPSEEYADGLVSLVMQKGYRLNGRLVRPAMVMVAKNG